MINIWSETRLLQEVKMFQFCTVKESDLESILIDGFIASEKIEWHKDLNIAKITAEESDRVSLLVSSNQDMTKSPMVSELDFVNLNPLIPLKAIAAAGGYLVRMNEKGKIEVLLIYRRGKWDLPKGKVDPGETIDQAGIREVEEEVGAKGIEILAKLEESHHTYPHKGKLVFKTTSWYVMTTTSDELTPQAEEDIQKLEWFEWENAERLLGYDSLKQHMARIDQEEIAALLRKSTDLQV